MSFKRLWLFTFLIALMEIGIFLVLLLVQSIDRPVLLVGMQRLLCLCSLSITTVWVKTDYFKTLPKWSNRLIVTLFTIAVGSYLVYPQVTNISFSDLPPAYHAFLGVVFAVFNHAYLLIFSIKELRKADG